MFIFKKGKTALVIITAIIILTGCMRQSSTDLGWQKFPLSFSASVEAFGRLTDSETHIEVTVTEPYCGSISFVSEGSLNGYTFTLRKNEGDISYGDIQVPMSEHIITDMRYFFSLFALDTDHLTELSVKQQGEESINVAVFSLFCEDREFPENPSGIGTNTDSQETEAGTDIPDNTEPIQIGTVTVHLSDGIPVLMDAEYSSGEHVVLKISNFVSQYE